MNTPVKAVTNNGQETKTSPLSTVKTPPVPVVEKKPEAEKPASIEDRMHRLNILFDLQKKYNKWQDTRKTLQDFEVAQNKENSSLELTDDDGNEFKTTNPVVIAEVTKFILQVVNSKITEVEKQIVF